MARRGNCYVATEALWHILGGADSQWDVMRMKVRRDTHWFLRRREDHGIVLDPSRQQFSIPLDYSRAKRAAFLTTKPSRRAQALMDVLTWQSDAATTLLDWLLQQTERREQNHREIRKP